MSSSGDIVEIKTHTKKKLKKKQKIKQKSNNDSVQIIEEISNSQPSTLNNDTSIEIISEHLVNSSKSSMTLDQATTESESTKFTSPSEESKDDIDSSSNNSTTCSKKRTGFIAISSQTREESTNQSEASLKNQSSSMEESQPEEDFSDLFQIDRAPHTDTQTGVPKYTSKFSESALSEEKVEKKKSWRQPAMCFNCNGEHSMRDCKKPRNQNNINRNRNVFLANKMKQTGNVSASRYHLDHHQRFAHIKPGKISRHLRKALKLSHDQLPLHIYRMRMVGYPPAWLEEAKVNHSGITVFDSSGQALADPDDEDGEVEVDRCKYDMKKLIEFPGFNVRPPKGTLNESDYLGFPDMISEQNKDRMISYLSPRAALPYKKRKLEDRDLPPPGTEEDLNRTGASLRHSTDMEVDDVPETKFEAAGDCAFIPSLPEDPAPPPPPPPPASDEEDGEIREDEVEEAKKAEEGKGTKRKREETENGSESTKKRKSIPESTPTSASHPDLASTASPSTIIKSASFSSLGSIKTVDMGTPIIDHAVSSERLPSHEAFSKNICDVINFDNLPDSTGKYKLLSKVVKKVRKVMAKLTAKNS